MSGIFYENQRYMNIDKKQLNQNQVTLKQQTICAKCFDCLVIFLTVPLFMFTGCLH